MKLKILAKVPLVLLENILFSIFPNLRPFIERYCFNPLDFKESHRNYSQGKFREFQERIGPYATLENHVLLEIGPGGSIGFGIIALENGLKRYIALDDGIHTFIKSRQLRTYEKLVKNTTSLQRYFIRKNGKVTYNNSVITLANIHQKSRYPLPENSVDIIYSCAVLEHVHNLELCFSEMARVLKNGGLMYHEVDLRDHIFSQENLYFLTMRDFWFRTLFRNTGGYVNRKRLSAYRQLAHTYGFTILSLVPTIAYQGNDDELPKTLRTKYSKEDIQTLAFIIILQKSE